MLVDQFDQTQGAVLPQAAAEAAVARFKGTVAFSWVGMRLTNGDAGIPALQSQLAHLATQLGDGIHFALRRLDTIHGQVQQAIEPQAVALGVFGGLVALAMLALVGQGLAELLHRSAPQLEVLEALGMTRFERAVAGGIAGGVAVVAGMVLAVGGAVALSPLAPVGPVRQFDPARGVSFDSTVFLGGGLVLTVRAAGSGGLVGLAGARARCGTTPTPTPPPSPTPRSPPGCPPRPPSESGSPCSRRRDGAGAACGPTWSVSIVAVTAVITAVVFGASLNGVVSHPVRYGWNWNVLIQSQGGYGDWYGFNMDKLMAAQPGVRRLVDLRLHAAPDRRAVRSRPRIATHGAGVEPPTVSGRPLDGPNQIELGATTLRQLGKHVGDTVEVGTGATARRLKIVGAVTLPSIGVQLADHVSLGRGAMLPEHTLLSIENFFVGKQSQAAFTALPSTLAIDLRPGAPAHPMVQRILAAEPDDTPGGMYQIHPVLAATLVNDAQMGDQPLTLAVVLAAAMVLSIWATVQASTRRRRRDLAMMKALGMTRRQLRAIVLWQSSTILVIAAGLGLVLGWVVGRLVWSAFASSIGVVPVTVLPLGLVLLGLLILVVAGDALTLLPAESAARAPSASLLRSE